MPPAYRDSPPRRQAGELRPPSAIGGRCRRASRHGAAARACAPRGRSRARRRAPWSASSARRTRSRCSSGASRPPAGVSSATRRPPAARLKERPPRRHPCQSARHLDKALAATVARARAAEGRREELGEVVVTAPPTREAAPARDPTAFATVIDTSSAPTRVETLAEALADTVGVQVRRFGGLGDFSTVSIRGSSAGQVQVYLDGVPLGRAQNETVNLADLPLDAVDHVEVYRGPTPLAFSQSGPRGIVNVLPRPPAGTPVTDSSDSNDSLSTRKVDLARAASAGPWDYLAFAHYLGSAGDFAFTGGRGEVSLVPLTHPDRPTAGGVQALFGGATGAHQGRGLLLAAGQGRFAAADRLDPAGNAPDRSRLRTTLAAEDEIVLAAD